VDVGDRLKAYFQAGHANPILVTRGQAAQPRQGHAHPERRRISFVADVPAALQACLLVLGVPGSPSRSLNIWRGFNRSYLTSRMSS
jgi:hypothetical protein